MNSDLIKGERPLIAPGAYFQPDPRVESHDSYFQSHTPFSVFVFTLVFSRNGEERKV